MGMDKLRKTVSHLHGRNSKVRLKFGEHGYLVVWATLVIGAYWVVDNFSREQSSLKLMWKGINFK